MFGNYSLAFYNIVKVHQSPCFLVEKTVSFCFFLLIFSIYIVWFDLFICVCILLLYSADITFSTLVLTLSPQLVFFSVINAVFSFKQYSRSYSFFFLLTGVKVNMLTLHIKRTSDLTFWISCYCFGKKIFKLEINITIKKMYVNNLFFFAWNFHLFKEFKLTNGW